MSDPFLTLSNDLMLVADVVFLDKVTEAPTTFKFAERPFYDAVAGIVYRASLAKVGATTLSRVSGVRLTGGSTPDSGDLTITSSPALLAALAGKHCERQSMILRRGRPSWPLSQFKTIAFGMAVGHEADRDDVRIRPYSLAQLFELPYQPRKWAGLGRVVELVPFVDESDPPVYTGSIDAPPPESPADWNLSVGLTVEIGFRMTQPDSGWEMELASRATQWQITRNATTHVLEAKLFPGGGGSEVSVSGTTPLFDEASLTHHVVGIRWDASTFDLLLDGVQEGSSAAAVSAVAGASHSIVIGGGAIGKQFQGWVDSFRFWNVRRSNLAIKDALDAWPGDGDQVGLLLGFRMLEGFGLAVFDGENELRGDFLGNASWISSKTGMLAQRGQTMPSAFGSSPDAAPVLIDNFEQRFAFGDRDMSTYTIGVKIGGRRLARDYSVNGTVVFLHREHRIEDETNNDWGPFVAGQKIIVTGSTKNDGTYTLARPPYQRPTDFGLRWRLVVVEPLTPDGISRPGVGIRSGSYFVEPATVQGTVDFLAADRTIVAKSGQSFGAFVVGRRLDIVGSVSNDTTSPNFQTIVTAPWIDGATGEWTLRVDKLLVQELRTAGVTLDSTVDVYGEFEPDLANAQFRLFFVPTKPVSVEILAPDAASATASAISTAILANMGTPATQALSVDTARLTALAATYPQTHGFYDPGGTTVPLRAPLDALWQSLGAQWFIRRQDGKFSAADVPPTAPVNLPVNANRRLFSISRDRGVQSSQAVIIRFRRVHQVLALGEMDLYVQGDNTEGGEDARAALQSEWQETQYPRSDLDADLFPYGIETTLFLRIEAEAIAQRLYRDLFGTAPLFYELSFLFELQPFEPFDVVMRLTDDDDPLLGANTATGVTDFNLVTMTITARSGQSFDRFQAGGWLEVTGSLNNDTNGNRLTINTVGVDGFQHWFLIVDEALSAELKTPGVTLETDPGATAFVLAAAEGQTGTRCTVMIPSKTIRGAE